MSPSRPSAPPALARLLSLAIDERVTPGGVIEIGDAAGPVWTVAAGRQTYAADAPAVTAATVYDLASLTKVVATTTLALAHHASGTLPLDTLVAARRPEFSQHPAFTVRDLLEHAAGFPAHRPYFRQVAGRAAYLSRIAHEPLAYPPRTRHEYTDLGFILLGALVEDAARAPLDVQFDRFIDDAMPGAELGFGARATWHGRVAPTGVCPWRGRVMAGHVHDANAGALGGVAGHAGLFGTAAGVGAFARWWLGLWTGAVGSSRVLSGDLVRQAVHPGRVPGSSRALGWDTMLPTSSCGTRLSTASIGHTGFTGTSLWIDPLRGLYVACLTNRVHASDDLDGIRMLRVAVHDLTAEAWDAAGG